MVSGFAGMVTTLMSGRGGIAGGDAGGEAGTGGDVDRVTSDCVSEQVFFWYALRPGQPEGHSSTPLHMSHGSVEE